MKILETPNIKYMFMKKNFNFDVYFNLKIRIIILINIYFSKPLDSIKKSLLMPNITCPE